MHENNNDKKQLRELYIEDLGQVTGGVLRVTTMAIGEEDPATTLAIGEEDPTTIVVGEEDPAEY